MIAFRREKDLRLMHQPAERFGVDDPVAVALEGCTQFARRFFPRPSAGMRGFAGVRGKVFKFLLFTDLDLMQISEMTGYADCSHMIKNFKRIMNITPGQYRLKNR